MKNRILAAMLCGILLLSFSGCGTEKSPSESFPTNTEPVSETESTVPAEQNIQSTDVSEKKQSDSSSSSDTANPKSEPSSDAKNSTRHHPTDTPSTSNPSKPSSASAETNSDKTNPQNQPTSAPIPSQSNPTPTKPSEPQFDINYWVSYAKNYAQSVGLHLNTSAVDCWDNPISANAKSKYLERDIQRRLNRYAKDEDITDIWIWAEKVADNSYEIYIGYA